MTATAACPTRVAATAESSRHRPRESTAAATAGEATAAARNRGRSATNPPGTAAIGEGAARSPKPAAGEFDRLLAVATGLAKDADPEAEVPVRPAPPP